VPARSVFYEENYDATILLAIEDITEQRAKERELEELLQHKELLLREMHGAIAPVIGEGRTHTVAVTEDRFEYGGTSYPSLTKIAKKITGAQWSGPRFFGLPAAGAERPSNGGRNG